MGGVVCLVYSALRGWTVEEGRCELYLAKALGLGDLGGDVAAVEFGEGKRLSVSGLEGREVWMSDKRRPLLKPCLRWNSVAAEVKSVMEREREREIVSWTGLHNDW